MPAAEAQAVKDVSRVLTIGAMAALGLGVELAAVTRVGRPVALAVVGSLVFLILLALLLVRLV